MIYDEDAMPVVCESCKRMFDMSYEGRGSDKWYPGIVICNQCSDLEGQEIDIDDEIESEENNLADAKWQVEESTKELEKLRLKQTELQDKIEQYKQ